MHNRLKQFLAAENITQAQFASTIQIGKANISHVLSGRNKPGYDFIKAIMLGYPHLNMNWLMLGTGKMYDLQQPQKEKPAPDPDGTILFDDENTSLFDGQYEEETEEEALVESNEIETVDQDNAAIDLIALSSLKELANIPQTTVRQRKVSKIVVLFDDGSFQEL